MRYLLFFLALVTLAQASYVVPEGLPDPALTWGVLHPVDTPLPVRATIAPRWFLGTPAASTIALGGPADCYYIDSSQVGATDSSNPNGYPGHARLTPPNNNYSAGAYIEIHGDGGTGTYVYSATTFSPRGLGTAATPIWIVGINNPIIGQKLDFGTSNFTESGYFVVDGLWFRSGGRIDVRPRFDNNSLHHIAFRNCNLNGGGLVGVGTGFAVGCSQVNPLRPTNDIFIYHCDIGYYGSKTAPNEECGFYPSGILTRVWVTDCDIHDVAEDGMAGAHGFKRTCDGYYIGRNNIHDNVTNGIDIKQCEHVVISQNNISGAHISTPFQSGAGEAIVLHYSGTSTPGGEFDAWKNWPADVSVIYNIIHDSDFGVVCSTINKCRIIGNVFYNINHSTPFPDFNVTSPYSSGAAIQARGVRGNLQIANNTFNNCDINIELADTYNNYSGATTYFHGDIVFYATTNKVYECILDNSGSADPAVGISGTAPTNATYWREFRYQIWGNVGTARAEPTGSDLFISANGTTGDFTNDIDYNLFYASGGEHYCYGSSTQHDLTWFKANSVHQDHGLSSDPLLVAPGGLNFALGAGSPAINSSTEGTGTTAYADFEAVYGLAIRVDQNGATRPVVAWDMGAFEYAGVSDIPRDYHLRFARRR